MLVQDTTEYQEVLCLLTLSFKLTTECNYYFKATLVVVAILCTVLDVYHTKYR